MARPSSFLDHLKRTCPRDIGRVIKGITRTLAISYQEDGSRMTAAETTRRFEICLSALELMTMDHPRPRGFCSAVAHDEEAAGACGARVACEGD